MFAHVQVEQGLFLGPDRPLFNRARLTATHFHQIGKASPGEAPKSLVVHGKAGGCIGDQPPYDLFTLGGPFSVSTPSKSVCFEISSARH